METTEKTNELVTLVETSGLEKSKQNQIAETLGVFFNKATEWDATIQSIVITSPEETGKMKMAKEGRLTLKKMRLEAEKIVKDKRDEVKYAMANFVLEDKLWLKAGQMMEATFKNLETKLEEKEKFAERWEAERKEKLKSERLQQLLPLGFQYENGFDLGNMEEAMFNSLKLGLETAKKEKEEAERKAEEERIAKEKAEAEAKAKMEAENKRLREEAEIKNKRNEELRPYIVFIRDYNKMISLPESEYKNEFAEVKKGAELHWEFERKEQIRKQREAEEKEKQLFEAKAKAEKDAKILELRIKAEKDAKEKLEAELKAKEEAELKAKKEAELKAAAELKAKQQAEAKAAKAPKKEKLNIWVESFNIVIPAGMNDDETAKEIIEKFEAFKKWAKTKIDAI